MTFPARATPRSNPGHTQKNSFSASLISIPAHYDTFSTASQMLPERPDTLLLLFEEGRLKVFYIVWIFFFSYSEYIKVIDGNGITVLSRYGYSSATQKTFRKVSFGNSGNITVQIYLRRSYSNFRLQFGILKQGLQSG